MADRSGCSSAVATVSSTQVVGVASGVSVVSAMGPDSSFPGSASGALGLGALGQVSANALAGPRHDLERKKKTHRDLGGEFELCLLDILIVRVCLEN